MPICLRLFLHCVRRAASRAACTAGSNNATRMAIIVITTNSSIKVKARRRWPVLINVSVWSAVPWSEVRLSPRQEPRRGQNGEIRREFGHTRRGDGGLFAAGDQELSSRESPMRSLSVVAIVRNLGV